MKKSIVIIVIIVVVVVGLAITLDYRTNRVVDWTESFNEKSNKPYGLSVLYHELPNLFKKSKIRTVYHTPSVYLYANSEDGYGDHVAKGSYLIIGNSGYLKAEDCTELLYFVSQGNTLFISDYDFPEKLMDTLGIKVEQFKTNDSIVELHFKYPNLEDQHIQIDKCPLSSYFSNFEGDGYKPIGYYNNDETLVNFLEVPFKEGYIFLQLEPKVFSNYNLLKDNKYVYTEGVLSYLPDEDIYFDSFTKYFDSYYGSTNQRSDLGWFLQQTSFRWAWYMALILTVLFVIFNAKRRQRIINTLKPLENTTLGFVKTISNLYFETQDHKNLIDKKIIYFLEKVRADYHVETSVLDEEFINTLASKSGKKKEKVKKLVNFINWLRTKNEFFEDNLLKLNRHIEDFYSN